RGQERQGSRRRHRARRRPGPAAAPGPPPTPAVPEALGGRAPPSLGNRDDGAIYFPRSVAGRYVSRRAPSRRGAGVVERGGLENRCVAYAAPWVRIPPSPPTQAADIGGAGRPSGRPVLTWRGSRPGVARRVRTGPASCRGDGILATVPNERPLPVRRRPWP